MTKNNKNQNFSDLQLELINKITSSEEEGLGSSQKTQEDKRMAYMRLLKSRAINYVKNLSELECKSVLQALEEKSEVPESSTTETKRQSVKFLINELNETLAEIKRYSRKILNGKTLSECEDLAYFYNLRYQKLKADVEKSKLYYELRKTLLEFKEELERLKSYRKYQDRALVRFVEKMLRKEASQAARMTPAILALPITNLFRMRKAKGRKSENIKSITAILLSIMNMKKIELATGMQKTVDSFLRSNCVVIGPESLSVK